MGRPPLAMKTSSSNTSNKPTYCKVLSRTGGPYRINCIQQHTLTLEENGVLNTISVDRAAHAPSGNTNVNVIEWRATNKGVNAVKENQHHKLEKKSRLQSMWSRGMWDTLRARVEQKLRVPVTQIKGPGEQGNWQDYWRKHRLTPTLRVNDTKFQCRNEREAISGDAWNAKAILGQPFKI